MYSQSDEEKYILEFFKDKNDGRIIEIGAYHPTTLSNSRALIEKGWEAVLIEPSPQCFINLEEFYKNNEKVKVVNVAIGPVNDKIVFYDSGGAVATAIEEHYNLWKNTQLDYKQIVVPCITWDTFLLFNSTSYDFISIDCEGMDYTILNQMNLQSLNCSLLCIECSYDKELIAEYLYNNKFDNIIYYNDENIIVTRRK
jgi:FkbM family methyltransferase